ncbi:hypothetical protein Desku_3288 [Calderihabitans maritimus]|uniref:Uncharacterized protein n=3 Tax=Calderihabitans maritimus TaxID=1246530 RepID=A0A1Z5HV91_9FIRM|nr:hypothetical protein Desku_3288 [Calderihabitans maritimus]
MIPAVFAGTPNNSKSYQKLVSEGINVYLPRNITVKPEGLEISLRGIAFFKQLEVSGLQV